MDAKMSTWRPGTAVCRCCLAEGCYKDISTEYFWMGKREVYAEMLTETFDLAISYSQSGGPNSNSRLICEPCISRLRDASEFKRQVYDCEKMFMQHLEPTGSGIVSTEVEIEPLNKDVKVEAVKEEKEDSGDDFFDDRNDFGDDDDDDDLDDEPLTKLATKVPKKEKKVDLLDFLEKPAVAKPAAEKRKAPAPPKPKATPVKKVKVVKEAKPSASKDKVVEKKKKDGLASDAAADTTRLILKHSTAYVFNLQIKGSSHNIECCYCSGVFDDPERFRWHVDDSHSDVDRSLVHHRWITPRVDITNLRCRLCSQPMETLDKLVEHFKSGHGMKIQSKPSAIVPMKLNKDLYICLICSKRFSERFSLFKHSGTHFGSYICDACGKNYQTKFGLRVHTEKQHANAGKFICAKCKELFDTKEELKKHGIETKHGLASVCPICDDRFTCKELRDRHLVEVHNKPKKTFPCSECGAVFSNCVSKNTHFKAAHTEDLMCTYCGKKFGLRRNLMDHTNTHTGERPYTCTVCNKTFAAMRQMNKHRRHQHSASQKTQRT